MMSNKLRLWLPLALCAAMATSVAAQPNVEFAPGEILVKFKPYARHQSHQVHGLIQATAIGNVPKIHVQRVKLPAGMSVQQGLNFYRQFTTVEYAEPNVKFKPGFVPNDPRVPQQYSLQRMQVFDAWDFTFGHPDVVIAVLDTGIDLNHPDLKDKIAPGGYDWSDNDNDPTDAGEHGTHVSGIAAAHTNNGIGIAGVGFHARVLPLKVFPNSFADVIANAIVDAADKNARVINMSLGAYFFSNVMNDAANYAWSQGAVIVASAGNDNVSFPAYPAAYPNVIAVGSTAGNDQKSGFSNWGDWVDVAAPGSAVLSTIPGGGYAAYDGTSMSAPNVAGVVALMWAYAPGGMTNAEIRQILEENTDFVGNWLRPGQGRVNALRAVSNIIVPETHEMAPNTAVAHQGQHQFGTTQSLLNADGNQFAVHSVRVSRLGSVASVRAHINFSQPASKFIDGELVMHVAAPLRSTLTTWMWNFHTSNWDLIRSMPGNPENGEQRIELPRNMNPYVSGNEMRVVVRTLLPARLFRNNPPPFTMYMDKLRVSARFRP
jgi:thermitase